MLQTGRQTEGDRQTDRKQTKRQDGRRETNSGLAEWKTDHRRNADRQQHGIKITGKRQTGSRMTDRPQTERQHTSRKIAGYSPKGC